MTEEELHIAKSYIRETELVHKCIFHESDFTENDMHELDKLQTSEAHLIAVQQLHPHTHVAVDELIQSNLTEHPEWSHYAKLKQELLDAEDSLV